MTNSLIKTLVKNGCNELIKWKNVRINSQQNHDRTITKTEAYIYTLEVS